MERYKNSLNSILSNDIGYDFIEENLAKKGTAERNEQFKKKLFAKDKETYMRNALENLLDNPPSSDFRLLVNEKTKQNLIEKMITVLSAIPQIEQTLSDLPKTKEIFDIIKNKKLEGVELIEFLRKELVNIPISEFKKIKNDNLTSKLDEYIEKSSKKKLEKKRVDIGQEYYTPPTLVKKLIDMSGISNPLKKYPIGCNILEPTAGYGNIVKDIVNVVISLKINNASIDMVEFSADSRKFLTDNVVSSPFINLQKTTDFLEYVPSEKYDFIFMNPPFHLRKSTNIKYKKDYYDYDFVKRAFAMLKNDGVLVAIMGVDYLKNDNIVEWFKKYNFTISKPEKHKFNEGSKNESAKINNSIPIVFVKVIKNFKIISDVDNNKLLEIDEFNIGKNIDKNFIRDEALVNGEIEKLFL
jgi:tRNA1(Val) A37 N6-methylase TrmN6